ncbi:MAG TPA: TRAP transporter large permease [Alphaproteobacteria bacterium]
MTHYELALGVFCLLMALIVIRMPIAIAMFLAGAFGFSQIAGWDAVLNLMSEAPYSRVSNYELSVIPLFLLMGQLATRGGLSQQLYRSARAWLGHYRGGIAIATIGGCAAFGAICGSSIATGATMATVALPEMRRYGYSGSLATGALAAGGTLGILIPPSIVLVIFSILTEQSLGNLFLAAIIPGIIATLGYAAAIAIYVRARPQAAPPAEALAMAERIASLWAILPVAVIFTVVVGGIYLGVFTPTEGAAVGAATTGLLAAALGGLDFRGVRLALFDTAKLTGMIFIILVGAEFYSAFLALSQTPQALARWIGESGFAPLTVLVAIVIVYLLLGCVMDGLPMILITVPVFYPIVIGLDFGMGLDALAMWFGILVLIAVEVGLITPPIGINVYVINSMARDVPITESFKGIVPFFLSDLARIALIIAFPATCTFLPGVK